MGAHDLVWLIGVSVVLGLFIIVVSIWLASQLPDVVAPVDPAAPPTPTIFTCDPGDCKFSLLTGVKVCPSGQEAIAFEPTSEGCTAPFFCTFSQWTNAVQPDGSTDAYGRCQAGDKCTCLRTPICSGKISSTWIIDNDQYVPVDPWTQASARTRVAGQPLPVPLNQFCYLPAVEIYQIDKVRCTGTDVASLATCDAKYRDSVLQLCPGGRLAVYAEVVDPTALLEETTVACAQASQELAACPGLLKMSPSTGAVSCGTEAVAVADA